MKEHTRLIGRIIFADFLELSLKKYKHFIEGVKQSPLFDNQHARHCEEPRRSRGDEAISDSPRVVAKVVKSSKGFAIRYVYEGFNRVYHTLHCDLNAQLFYKLRRISSRNELTHKILRGIIKCQQEYLKTGNPIDLVSFSQVQLPIDNSWTSRLVNRLSVITPSGEEKPLRWFFQTQKDINKRIIKQLLDKENEDIESGRLSSPLTDNQLKAKLQAEYGLELSRWSVGHCRKDMGIPPGKRRLSGYKYPPLSENFSMLYPLAMESVIKYAPETSGIYELRVRGNIRYTKYDIRSTVFYIGSTKNLRKRLREHLGKNSKNGSIRDFLKKSDCSFRYILFKKDWQREEKRLYRLFMDTYGSSPVCNRVSPVGN